MKEISNFSKSIYHDTIGYLISIFKDKKIEVEFSKLESGDYFSKFNPEYISQLGGADSKTIKEFYGEINDENALLQFGAKNKQQFEYWAWRSCSLAVLKMAMSSFKKPEKTLMELVVQGVKLRGYDVENDIGWYHNTLAELARNYGLTAEIMKYVPSSMIARLINNDYLVAASVKSETGGHQYLVYGYKLSKDKTVEGFWFHDPNSYNGLGKKAYLGRKEFDKLFTRRLIAYKG